LGCPNVNARNRPIRERPAVLGRAIPREACMHAVIIEDDPNVSRSIEVMLKSENFSIYATEFGEEGIDLGKLYDYDVILLDLNLPNMSGYEVLRKLRLDKVKSPILILSGRGLPR
jgi:two-component system, cell cycle response regulator CtrA